MATVPLVRQSAESTRSVRVALCGNPNCGKSTLFNALTGLRQKVANYPGVTVEKVSGSFQTKDNPQTKYSIVDVPGTYSLVATAPDEHVAAQTLLDRESPDRPDLIVCVIDACHLERGLYLYFQVRAAGAPMVIALTMVDIARKSGLSIDALRLSKNLGGVPVVPVVANRGIGLNNLKEQIAKTSLTAAAAEPMAYDSEVIAATSVLAEGNGHRSRAEYLRVLFDEHGTAEKKYIHETGEQGRQILEGARQRLKSQFGSLLIAETRPLQDEASRLARLVTKRDIVLSRLHTETVDRYILHPVLGPVILFTLMVLIFQSIFSWAEPMMSQVDLAFAKLGGVIESVMAEGPLRSLIVDGCVGGVGSVVMFLPQILILFLYISLIEASGYMPRAALIVDRMFSWCGLSGKAFIPMLSSFACAIPGVMATRTIENRRVRLLTIIIAPLMSCSARLPVYTIMIAAFVPYQSYLGIVNSQGLVLLALYLLGLFVAIAIAFTVTRLRKREERISFVMEMPTYKLPTVRSVITQLYQKASSFLVRAGTVILAITIIVWALGYYPHSTAIDERYALHKTQASQELAHDLPALEQRLTLIEAEQAGEHLRNSYFGRIGRALEPIFVPLGWDWKITMAALASFPAREVVIATLGATYNLGTESDNSDSLIKKLQNAKWDSGQQMGLPVFTPAVALSIMVFFALCCQCGATVVTIRQETGTWWYSILAFTYMTLLAYIGALATFTVARSLGW